MDYDNDGLGATETLLGSLDELLARIDPLAPPWIWLVSTEWHVGCSLPTDMAASNRWTSAVASAATASGGRLAPLKGAFFHLVFLFLFGKKKKKTETPILAKIGQHLKTPKLANISLAKVGHPNFGRSRSIKVGQSRSQPGHGWWPQRWLVNAAASRA